MLQLLYFHAARQWHIHFPAGESWIPIFHLCGTVEYGLNWLLGSFGKLIYLEKNEIGREPGPKVETLDRAIAGPRLGRTLRSMI
jgi:hypothetical protein